MKEKYGLCVWEMAILDEECVLGVRRGTELDCIFGRVSVAGNRPHAGVGREIGHQPLIRIAWNIGKLQPRRT
jgi:hypothetical protein